MQAPADRLLVQVSDLHLQRTPQTLFRDIDVESRWLQVRDHIVAHYLNADLLLLTGDLIHHAGPDVYLRLVGSLSDVPFPVLWLPGNHDDPEQMSDVGGAGLNRRTVTLGNWQLICLDSTAEPDGLGGGELAETELNTLRRLLIGSGAEHQLVALHHNPVPVGSQWQDAISLRNAEAFWRCLSAGERVRGVLFGHVHQHWQLEREGVALFSAPAVAPQFKAHCDTMTLETDPALAGPGYVVYRLGASGRITVEAEVRLPAAVACPTPVG